MWNKLEKFYDTKTIVVFDICLTVACTLIVIDVVLGGLHG